MQMHDYAIQELKKLEKQIARDNRKLDALRIVIKEYATEDYPGSDKVNQLILECVQNHNGAASLQQLDDCIADHQIIMPRNKLSFFLTKHPQIKYDKEHKSWKIKQIETKF